MEKWSLFKLSGLPDPFGVVLLSFSFILLLAPYFSGADFGLFKIPIFTESAKRWLKILGPIVFCLCILSFIPIFARKRPASGNSNRATANVNGPSVPRQTIQSSPLVQYYVPVLDAKGSIKEQFTGQTSYFTEDLGNHIRIDMVQIPGDTFSMGSPDSEAGRDPDEGPQHEVRISSLFMSAHEVSQEQWRAIADLPKVDRELSSDPSIVKGNKLPVENVSWEDATEFCARLSREKKRQYRLPTEAEWEYACRARSMMPFAFGATISAEVVNYDGNLPYGSAPKGISRGQPIPGGSLVWANAFGLYDIQGNVWEWCEDNYHGGYVGAPNDESAWENADANGDRVIRGGSFANAASVCRCANRGHNPASLKFVYVGFRVVTSSP
jgi:formylglycine-generating enzyme required for sulfatase activity